MRNVVAATSRAPIKGTSSAISASLYGRNFSRAVSSVGSVVIFRLESPRQRHAGERAAQAEQIIAENVGQHQSPLTLLKICHVFERIAGKRRERAAEAHHYQQPPARVEQDALAGPDDEEAHDEAAHNVDDERSRREDLPKFSDSQPTHKES